MKKKTPFLIGAFILIGVSVWFILANDSTSLNYWPTLMFTFSIAANMLAQAYLAPYASKDDTRFRAIRSRSFFYTYFASLLYLFAAFLLVITDTFTDPVYLVLNLLVLTGISPQIATVLLLKFSIPH
ncbi:hypothetical protein [Paenibacillus lutrae]|uniref:Permease n=1 Tax=Paenibacillus lutrae TaxID=2078573 RepID=A0A7X3FKQ8_9BACL|nr:hypothetical protein [Paenibacillus lutrae]MVP01425.1 hypothetical protein [Paenibacillus lutrae]